jgi:hypothetical protein
MALVKLCVSEATTSNDDKRQNNKRYLSQGDLHRRPATTQTAKNNESLKIKRESQMNTSTSFGQLPIASHLRLSQRRI